MLILFQPFWPFTEYNPSMNPLAQPTLDFLAPECALTMTHSPASDMYSLGMVIYALHNSGQPVYSCGGDWNSYRRYVKEVGCPTEPPDCVLNAFLITFAFPDETNPRRQTDMCTRRITRYRQVDVECDTGSSRRCASVYKGTFPLNVSQPVYCYLHLNFVQTS